MDMDMAEDGATLWVSVMFHVTSPAVQVLPVRV